MNFTGVHVKIAIIGEHCSKLVLRHDERKPKIDNPALYSRLSAGKSVDVEASLAL